MGLIILIEPIFFKMKIRLLLIILFFVSSSYASDQINRGKEIAENICSVCHGVNGQANTGGGGGAGTSQGGGKGGGSGVVIVRYLT